MTRSLLPLPSTSPEGGGALDGLDRERTRPRRPRCLMRISIDATALVVAPGSAVPVGPQPVLTGQLRSGTSAVPVLVRLLFVSGSGPGRFDHVERRVRRDD